MSNLHAFGLAAVLLTGTVLGSSVALGQSQSAVGAPGATTAASYSFPVARGSYMAPHYTGGSPP
ncbi:MAG TPA: hypothetical protein VGM32_18110, partial [Rhodopila sp.]